MRLNLSLRTRFALLMAALLPLQGYAAMPVCQEQARTHAAAPAAAHTAASHADVASHTDAASHTAAPADNAASHTSAAPEARHDCAGADTARRHNCGQCCCAAAIALAPGNFVAPHFAVPEIAAATITPSPDGALDRLDRPPRFILAR